MKSAVQFGAGGIGRGFLGQLLSESGYEILFVDVDREIVEALNSRGSYPLELVGERSETLTISNIRAVTAEKKQTIADAIAQADFICTASGVSALPAISELLALGLAKREEEGAGPINVVICENLNGASAYLRSLIEQQAVHPSSDYLAQSVGLVQSVVARMVPVRTEKMLAKDSLLVVAESYPFLPIDAAAIRGEVPAVKGLIAAEDFQGYVERKLYIHNCMHAMCSYMGYPKGYKYVWEAASDEAIVGIVEEAMAGVCSALSKTRRLEAVGLAENVYDLLRRFRCKALGDTIARVAGDPIRKLGPGGRLIGSASLCLCQGIEPRGIIQSIGLALGYDEPSDESAQRLQKMLSAKGVEGVLQEVCKLKPNGQLSRLIVAEYKKAGHC